MTAPHSQHDYGLRHGWGLRGAQEISSAGAVVAVVDVLSFTTAVTVAVEQGIEVYPYRWRDASAAAFAEQHDAVLAVGRSAAARRTDPDPDGHLSLSPASILASAGVRRLVLPSPNGSTISAAMAGLGATVVAVCLRNVTAAAGWITGRVRDSGRPVVVVSAGERWADGELRPAAEDLLGAGLLLDRLTAAGVGPASPEAQLATAAGQLRPGEHWLAGTASGRELVATGFSADVAIAAAVDASEVVPVLVDGMFRAAGQGV